jgi:hypothetical protein
VRNPKGLSVTHLVTIPADLTAFAEIVASICPILVVFLRFATGLQIDETVGNSNDFQHMSREVSRGLFETFVTARRKYYCRVIEDVNGKIRIA